VTKPWPSAIVKTLPDQVVQSILHRIASGDLRPGQRLPSQRELARAMGVGLAAVREAIQRLTALKVLEATHGSGTVVRPFRWIPLVYEPSTFQLAVRRIGVQSLWEARRLLEGQIIRLAAERATEPDIEALRTVLARAEPLPGDYEASQALNREFHIALARAAQNQVLEDLVAPLLDVAVERAGDRFTHEICRLTWAAHWAIFEAVAARDVEAAERAVQAHFKIGPVALMDEAEQSRSGQRRRAPPGSGKRRSSG
jgi:DNA-binding FadR family transcriptional regulator